MENIRNKITTFYKLFGGIILVFCCVIVVEGQSLLETKTHQYDIKKNKGSFEYEVSTTGTLSNGLLDFTKTTEKSITVTIKSLKGEIGELHFKRNWGSNTNVVREKKDITLSKGKEHTIKYNLTKDGEIKIIIGFNIVDSEQGESFRLPKFSAISSIKETIDDKSTNIKSREDLLEDIDNDIGDDANVIEQEVEEETPIEQSVLEDTSNNLLKQEDNSSEQKKVEVEKKTPIFSSILVFVIVFIGIIGLGYYMKKRKSKPLPPKKKLNLKPLRRSQGYLEKEKFQTLIKEKKGYRSINIREIWNDSAISTIFISSQCATDIGVFIKATNKIAKEEKDDTPPEIGGFLLGFYTDLGEGTYQISLDEFISITPEENDVYSVAFGTQAWAKLDEIVTRSKTKAELIGWFHTHPGHGLFLSQPDLKIHNGFFRQKHKVAVEIETLTPNFDTAFFTRKSDGGVNNTEDRITKKWHHWTEIEKEVVT